MRVKASELKPGDVLNLWIGRVIIEKIKPYHSNVTPDAFDIVICFFGRSTGLPMKNNDYIEIEEN